jgi:hypothetical protein
MNEEIWSVEFVKENPELAVNAIKTLQTLVQDLEDKLNQVNLELLS